MDNLTKVLNVLPKLAPDIAAAILSLIHAPAITKEELLAKAESLDDETLAFLQSELAKS